MKELSIEEKAKACDSNYKVYAELINRLEDVKEAIKKQNYGIAMDVLCKPYPEFQVTTHSELKDEDERIRKTLVEFFVDWSKLRSHFWSISIQKILAWLEKQGNLMKALQISNAKIGELIEKNYYLKEQLEKQSEQKMKTPEESLGIDSDTYNKIVDECIYGEQKPIKEHNACEFCEDKYGCVSPCSMKLIEEQKPAWSEEDRDILFRTIDNLKFLRDTISIDPNYAINITDIEREITWLNSLNSQSTWKPRDEQLKAIKWVMDGDSPENWTVTLANLYNDLKKLREK